MAQHSAIANIEPSHPRLFTIPQFAARNPAWTPASVRAIRFNATSNGFSGAFKTLGRRVLVDERAFFEALEAAHPKRRIGARRGK